MSKKWSSALQISQKSRQAKNLAIQIIFHSKIEVMSFLFVKYSIQFCLWASFHIESGSLKGFEATNLVPQKKRLKTPVLHILKLNEMMIFLDFHCVATHSSIFILLLLYARVIPRDCYFRNFLVESFLLPLLVVVVCFKLIYSNQSYYIQCASFLLYFIRCHFNTQWTHRIDV